MPAKAKQIFQQYINVDSPNEVRAASYPGPLDYLHIRGIEKTFILKSFGCFMGD